MRRWIAALLCLVAWSSGASAAGISEAEQLYQAGDMVEAARIGRTQGSAAGLTLAARASLVNALYLAPEGQREELLQAAADDADQALQLEPQHVDAMLQLAVALGKLAEREDPLTAHMKGYGHRGRALIERAIALRPDDAWANGLLGIWHLQVVRRGGATLAQELYGANEADGRRLCRRAVELDTSVAAIRYGCARSLLDLDPEANRGEALAELRRVVETPVQDVAGRLLRKAASRDIEEASPEAPG